MEGNFNVEGEDGSKAESDEGYETKDDDDSDFYAQSVKEHLRCEQLSVLRRARRVIVKFQFSWYELVAHGSSEKRRYSGKLYRDEENRSLQLQSFMVSHTL